MYRDAPEAWKCVSCLKAAREPCVYWDSQHSQEIPILDLHIPGNALLVYTWSLHANTLEKSINPLIKGISEIVGTTQANFSPERFYLTKMTLDGHRVAPLTTNRAESFIRKIKDEPIVIIDSHAASDSGQIVVEPPRPGRLAKANYLMQVLEIGMASTKKALKVLIISTCGPAYESLAIRGECKQLIMNNRFDLIVLPTATNLITSITTPATVRLIQCLGVFGLSIIDAIEEAFGGQRILGKHTMWHCVFKREIKDSMPNASRALNDVTFCYGPWSRKPFGIDPPKCIQCHGLTMVDYHSGHKKKAPKVTFVCIDKDWVNPLQKKRPQ
ncbi:hypothetical protein M422DRAFT_264251 [Sphaerobolus stellatus SS14]|uniref:Uncharacterized protein n=1 Tax=Sphaerobolus stellatus (strain SS14) TaxID=990650 RepID=A0A0C9UWX4_SPHS4|nr:hypothetical protein M422DRAFT_264251 [Sphaerobolus stellatus SS14]